MFTPHPLPPDCAAPTVLSPADHARTVRLLADTAERRPHLQPLLLELYASGAWCAFLAVIADLRWGAVPIPGLLAQTRQRDVSACTPEFSTVADGSADSADLSANMRGPGACYVPGRGSGTASPSPEGGVY